MKVYFIAAEGSAGKSATIRALTGVWRFGKANVAFENPLDVKQVWVEVRSLQENEISVRDFLERLKSADCDAAIIAVRIGEYNNQPAARVYIEALIAQSYEVAGLCLIGDGDVSELRDSLVKVVKLDAQQQNTAANQRAAVLRRHWNIA